MNATRQNINTRKYNILTKLKLFAGVGGISDSLEIFDLSNNEWQDASCIVLGDGKKHGV